ncbi:hypothetical protein E4U55_001893 [Claviceps digitariae]|nr:hypothetical protein E4U55_001893 [Claviceps digitariae]
MRIALPRPVHITKMALSTSSPRSMRFTPVHTHNTVKRFIPEDMLRYMLADGKLLTNREMIDFLVEHDIEPDNGCMQRFPYGSPAEKAALKYGVRLAYSTRHIITPQHLRYFDFRGHPLAGKIRTHYARKKREQPLWMFNLTYGTASGVVRCLTSRRLTRSVYQALNELGFQTKTLPGSAKGNRVSGTLWMTVKDAIKTNNHPIEEFGQAVATSLAVTCNLS